MKSFLRNASAILQKQFKDVLKNKSVFALFIILPLVAFIFQVAIPDSMGIPNGMFALMFAVMFTGMVPANMMTSIIAEEREKKTLRMLIYSGVKPIEYLLGTGLFTLIVSIVGGIIFGLLMGAGVLEFFLFLAVFTLGCITSIVIGSAIGLFAKNQVSAPAIIMPVVLVMAFMPMLAQFNEGIRPFAQVFFTYQVDDLINNLTFANFTFAKFGIILANMAVFVLIFILAYRKVDLAE